MPVSSIAINTRQTVQCADTARLVSISPVPWKLGPLDQYTHYSIPVAIVFVYRSSGISFERLHRAMELLLDYYPQLTGRLHVDPVDGTYGITRIGAGAALFKAQCPESLDAFEEGSDRRLSIQELPGGGNDLLAPWDTTLDDESVKPDPLFSVQVTHFACGGVALGIRISHSVCDGGGFFQCVANLAELYRALETPLHDGRIPTLVRCPHIRPYIAEHMDRNDHDNVWTPEQKSAALAYKPSLYYLRPLDPQITDVQTSSANDKHGPSNLPSPVIGRIYRFSSQQLRSLKAFATDSNSTSWVSTYDALCALLHQHVYRARLQWQQGGPGRTLSPPDFLTPVNLRGGDRLADLPANYFPNAGILPYSSLPHELLLHSPLPQIAKHIHDLTRGGVPDTEHSKHMPDGRAVQDTLRWIAAQPDKRRVQHGFRYGNGAFMISQWTKFDVYGCAVFEQGQRPALVSPPFTSISLLDGLAYTLPTEAHAKETGGDRGAIDLNIALSGPLWRILDQDEVFNRFCSRIGKKIE